MARLLLLKGGLGVDGEKTIVFDTIGKDYCFLAVRSSQGQGDTITNSSWDAPRVFESGLGMFPSVLPADQPCRQYDLSPGLAELVVSLNSGANKKAETPHEKIKSNADFLSRKPESR